MTTQQATNNLPANMVGIGGNLATVWGVLSDTGVAVFVGIVITIAGFILQWLMSRRRMQFDREQQEFSNRLRLAEEKRAEELHLAKLEAIRRGAK